jgi:hypothetical protein
MQKNMIDHF